VGNTIESLWEAVTTGRSGIHAVADLPGALLRMPFAAEARGFAGEIADFGVLDKDQTRSIRKGIKVMCREIQMGVAAAQRALAHAGLGAVSYDVDRTGVVFGSDYILSGPDEFVDAIAACVGADGRFAFDAWAAQGLPQITPLWLLKYLPNMPASHIAIYNDLRGPSNSLTMREASAHLALGEASHIIARGAADTIVAGATGTRVHPLRTLHVVLQEEIACDGETAPGQVCRPFDLHRSGMVLGEGAGALVLEALDTARARGATILGEVVGSGSCARMDARGVGDLRGAVESALRQTLRTARLVPDDVGHVHAHGLSTRRSDAAEAQAIHHVFADRTAPVPVTAVKSYVGNTGAGCGVLEVIASLLALNHDRLFPVLNYSTPDPDCPVAVVTSDRVPPGDAFVALSLTPLGQASALAVRRFA
jgi:3-oxoacyl-[acyl-carrier-protein] synthase II